MAAAPVCAFQADFTYGYYGRLLRSYAGKYGLLPLMSYVSPGESPRSRMHLRRGIDICLDAALNVDQVEATAGYTSTYMFIPTSGSCDIPHPAGGARLRQLRGLGHEAALDSDVATNRQVMSRVADGFVAVNDSLVQEALGLKQEKFCPPTRSRKP